MTRFTVPHRPSAATGGGSFIDNNMNDDDTTVDINSLIADALKNPELSSSAQVLMQTMNYMNAHSLPLPLPAPAAGLTVYRPPSSAVGGSAAPDQGSSGFDMVSNNSQVLQASIATAVAPPGCALATTSQQAHELPPTWREVRALASSGGQGRRCHQVNTNNSPPLEPAHDSRSATHDPHEKQRIVSFGTTTTFPTPSREVEQPGLPEEEDDDTPADFFDLLMAKAFQDEDTNGGTAKGDVKMNGSSCNNGRADNGPAPTAAADVIKEQQHTHLQTTTDQPKSSQQQQQQQMQDMQERLRQVSQQQLEQFRLQRVRQQQEQLLRQQQQQQQLQNQPSVLSMQADLQVLRAMHANGTVSCNTSSSSQQEPNLIPPCMPVDRSNASRTLGGRKGKPSTKQAMLSPTSNTLSNKINKKKNDHNQNQAATANHKSSNFHYVKVIGGGIVKRRPTEAATSSKSFPTTASVKRRRVVSLSNLTPHSSLQTHLDGLLTSRGYAPQKRPSRQLGYRSPPTALQLASFGSVVCASIKSSDGAADRLRSLLKSGLSPNPTNKFGDSPFFNACKRGLYPLVKEFIDAGAEVRVADGLGRTPFHYVAWANPPCLQSAKAILEANGSEGARLLYVVDAHSKTPLDFVGDEWREKWIEFLESVKDAYWPVCNDNVSSNNDDDGDSSGSDAGIAYIPEAKDDGSAVIPDPPGALSPELAAGVASGRVLPEDARRLQQEQEALPVQQEQEPDCRDNPTGSV